MAKRNLQHVNNHLGRLVRMAHRYELGWLDGVVPCPECRADARALLKLEAGGRPVVWRAELRCHCGLALLGHLNFALEPDGELVPLHREHTWQEAEYEPA